MAIKAQDLRRYVIAPTLVRLARVWRGCDSEAAVRLLLGTAAAESDCGYRLVQEKGPALGIYQVEPATHTDVLRWAGATGKSTAVSLFRSLGVTAQSHDELVTNLAYATCIARLIYWRRPEPLPDKGDFEGLARYWKRFFNTEQGKGTVRHFMNAFDLHVVKGKALA